MKIKKCKMQDLFFIRDLLTGEYLNDDHYEWVDRENGSLYRKSEMELPENCEWVLFEESETYDKGENKMSEYTKLTAESVSNDQLLIDIKNTEIEISAYNELIDGFGLLSKLPENDGYKKSEYLKKHKEYCDLFSECQKFLGKLYEIKRNRGL